MTLHGQNEQPFDRVRELIPGALQLAVKLAGNVHDAEDILQETLLRAAQNLEHFRGEAALKTWLTRILINVWRTAGRRRASAISTAELPMEGLAAPLESESEPDREQRESIAAAVSRLAERQREVLVLIVYEEMTAPDVAALLGISIQNVYSNLSAARAQLRNLLASDLIR